MSQVYGWAGSLLLLLALFLGKPLSLSVSKANFFAPGLVTIFAPLLVEIVWGLIRGGARFNVSNLKHTASGGRDCEPILERLKGLDFIVMERNAERICLHKLKQKTCHKFLDHALRAELVEREGQWQVTVFLDDTALVVTGEPEALKNMAEFLVGERARPAEPNVPMLVYSGLWAGFLCAAWQIAAGLGRALPHEWLPCLVFLALSLPAWSACSFLNRAYYRGHRLILLTVLLGLLPLFRHYYP